MSTLHAVNQAVNSSRTGNNRPSLKDLCNLVVTKVAHKWKDLGLQLLQSDQANRLNVIEANHPHDVESCCKCVLEKWLNTSTDATWNKLIEALKSPSVQLDYVANQLEQNTMATATQSGELEKCKEDLKHCYRKRINQKKSTKWPRLGDPTFYVDITIVRATFLPARLNEEHGMGLTEIRNNSYVTHDELLKDGYGKIILIEGDPGAGKTTFTFQLCKKWAEGVLLMEDIVFWIPLRHYKSVTTTSELFDKLGYPEMMDYAQQNRGKGMVIILDGWDELPNQLQTSSPFHDIIFGADRTFIHSTIIVTSRPTCSGKIAEAVEETNSYYKILGFDVENVKTYVKAYFHDQLSSQLLFNFLATHELHQDFYNPIFIAIMCFVFRSDSKLFPQTISKFYERFIILHLRSSIPDSCSQDLTKFDTLDNVPEKMKSLFHKFCKIAFDMVIDNKSVLHEGELEFIHDELDNLQLKQFDGFGLLRIDHYTSPLANMYSFTHQVVQEVLAAIFILNTDSIIDDAFEKYFYKNSNLENVFVFIFGLGSKEVLIPLADKLIEKFKKSDQNITFLSSILHCLFEANDVTLCREFAKVFRERKDIGLWTPTLFDYYYASYFIAVCGIKRLNVTMHCNILSSPDYHFMIIAQCLQNASIDIASFRFVKYGEVMSCKGMEQLAKALSTQHNILSVELIMIDFDAIYGKDCVAILCDSICMHNPDITNLVLPSTSLSEKDFESISSVLTTCSSLKSLKLFCLPTEHMCLDLSMSFCKALCETTSLQKLVLDGWNLSQADSKVFGNIISKNCSLKQLCICVDTVDCLDPIMNGLSSNMSITRFELYDIHNKSGHSRSVTLGKHLEKCFTLNHLLNIVNFGYASWSPSHLIHICTGLCTNTTLVTLGLSGCYIDAEACHAVCGMLSQNRTLRHLFLNPVHLEKHEAIELMDSCRHNGTLEVLALVQWLPRRNSHEHEQGKDLFQYSCDPEINHVLQKVQDLRQDKGESLLKVYWKHGEYLEFKEQVIPTRQPWQCVTI